MKQLLRLIPPVHELQKNPRFKKLMDGAGVDSSHLTNVVKDVLSQVRTSISAGSWTGPKPGNAAFEDALFIKIESALNIQLSYTLKRVINATGTILHTNLGRARLSDRAIRHVIETAQNYSNLEYRLEEGERGSRHSHVESLLKQITGAESAMVVNNNAAAVFLILTALAKNKEVVVSRGQLVEIGGSFRISSIMEESGAKLVEIGTTNKTHLSDYEDAINEETAMILKVHTSNFKVIGFTKSVETDELARLAGKHEQTIFYEDLGSGVLHDFRRHGIGDEPVVSEVLKMGADIVSFSGDKLLGGPQAGIIAGKKILVDKLKKHQLARVVRVDKMTLAALEGTLMDYFKGRPGLENIPTVRDLLATPNELKNRTENFVKRLTGLSDSYDARTESGTSQVGGGTMPDVELPAFIAVVSHHSITAEQLAARLRTDFSPSIVCRIQRHELHFDLRTVSPEEEELILSALKMNE
ncbi:L-seryl-tRNA(Sec) selenium transferase [Bacillus sp. T33-2]|uniref:L-seryl-tRNA(Sec) selenium transferase n=1 Tax=Bacillus sp. T33-2 TaxID=2054168 RepID=UPI000C784D70|nr:L-seryl-tRNA(Sec) selenium transferase [Bacillus sp. T33-2]PLR95246.1 L-seryl-tRNA(Sec) selenium transferase [Bacillus sp. T33-2]